MYDIIKLYVLKDRKHRLDGGEWEPQISFETLGPWLTNNPKQMLTKDVRYTC